MVLAVPDLIAIINKNIEILNTVIKNFLNIKEKEKDISNLGIEKVVEKLKEIFMVNRNFQVVGSNKKVPDVPVNSDVKNIEVQSNLVKKE